MGSATATSTAKCSQLNADRWQFGHLIIQSRKTVPQSWQYQTIFDIVLNPRLGSVLDQLGKLSVLDTVTTFQIDGRVVHQPKMRRASVCWRQIFQRGLVNQNRVKQQHASVEGTRLHSLTVAVKHRHPKSSAVVEGEPVAISALHRIDRIHSFSQSRDVQDSKPAASILWSKPSHALLR